MNYTLTGACHCGKLRLTFETPTPPQDLPLRACGCAFCRKHGVRTTSDPAGRLTFTVDDPDALNRYRFGTRTAETLICRNCGIYIGVTTKIDGALYGAININALDDTAPFDRTPQVNNYDGEKVEQRTSRRRVRWTPAEFIPG
jgi:hypothetical protein